MALPFELRDIMEFMLIGIMLAYTLVALCLSKLHCTLIAGLGLVGIDREIVIFGSYAAF